MYCDISLTGVTRGRDVTVDVTWSQDGVPVTENSRVTISGVTSDAGRLQSSLSFTPVHFSDMATYECRVTLTLLLGPPSSPVTSSNSIYLNISGLWASKFSLKTFFHLFRAGGPGGSRRHCIQGGGVRECCHPVDSDLHILLPRDICSTVWH